MNVTWPVEVAAPVAGMVSVAGVTVPPAVVEMVTVMLLPRLLMMLPSASVTLTFAVNALLFKLVTVQVNKHGELMVALVAAAPVQARLVAAPGLTVKVVLAVIVPSATFSVGVSAFTKVIVGVAVPAVKVTEVG
ncbi:MAG TPA: hypothetical protein VJ914_31585 [Pseudonocardiaceae bacterium]|nr:hypothetical protein [Pseudonocardiaceae bacterium]